MFAGAKPSGGRGCIKQSSAGLDRATVLTHHVPPQGSAELSHRAVPGHLSFPAGKLCCLPGFAEKHPA